MKTEHDGKECDRGVKEVHFCFFYECQYLFLAIN